MAACEDIIIDAFAAPTVHLYHRFYYHLTVSPTVPKLPCKGPKEVAHVKAEILRIEQILCLLRDVRT